MAPDTSTINIQVPTAKDETSKRTVQYSKPKITSPPVVFEQSYKPEVNKMESPKISLQVTSEESDEVAKVPLPVVKEQNEVKTPLFTLTTAK